MSQYAISIERKKVLGKEIQSRRLRAGFTLEDMVYRTGLNKHYFERLEEGSLHSINPLVLIKLGEIFELNYMLLYQVAGYVHNLAVIRYLTVENDVYPMEDDNFAGSGKPSKEGSLLGNRNSLRNSRLKGSDKKYYGK